ncbi:MAG TPA: hypothetical protein VGZ31_05940 [Chthoniobacterales bacterium]|jgi:hypothetical protein|nr:hypothetical protein [Chthoniobacterales bacterium]
MNGRLAAIVTMSIFLSASVYAANPFLNAQDNKPVSANFRGTEWNDENIQGEIPLSAQVITTRIAQMPWGAIFKIEFVDLKSRAKERREIRPQYFIATDDRIVLLNEENNDEAAKKISAMDKPPEFEQGYVRAIISGKLQFEDGPYTTTIEVKDDECIYLTNHNSGHFGKFVWKKGVGLIEHSSGYGAMKDGFRLKRTASKK